MHQDMYFVLDFSVLSQSPKKNIKYETKFASFKCRAYNDLAIQRIDRYSSYSAQALLRYVPAHRD